MDFWSILLKVSPGEVKIPITLPKVPISFTDFSSSAMFPPWRIIKIPKLGIYPLSFLMLISQLKPMVNQESMQVPQKSFNGYF
jgi:hypothetical protein